MIVIAAVVAVAALVAVFLVADYLGYNPLTAPPAEEQPAAPPTELEPQPIVPETKIELSAFRILGGGRTPASIRRDLAGKAKSLAGLFEGHGAGELLVDLAVSRSGAVARAKVLKSTYNKPAIESKVAYALRGWKFGPARGATTLKVKISVK